MVSLPIRYTPPTVIDIHDYTDVRTASPSGAPTSKADLTVADSDEAADATALDNAIADFAVKYGDATTTVIFGETFSSDNTYGPVPANMIPDKLEGYAKSKLATHSVIFRPWGNTVSSGYAFPEDLTAFKVIAAPAINPAP